jgi:hypothetical protein
MARCVVVAVLLVTVAAACSTADPDEERWKRDMFKVPRYQARTGQQQQLNEIGDIWDKGDECHYAALAEDDPVKKEQLLRQAVACFSRALGGLEALRDAATRADERERYEMLMLKVKEDITNSQRLLPITGE